MLNETFSRIFKPEICQEPEKLAELGVRNFCGDFNARNSKIQLLDIPQ